MFHRHDFLVIQHASLSSGMLRLIRTGRLLSTLQSDIRFRFGCQNGELIDNFVHEITDE
jgi:hypothetical protein